MCRCEDKRLCMAMPCIRCIYCVSSMYLLSSIFCVSIIYLIDHLHLRKVQLPNHLDPNNAIIVAVWITEDISNLVLDDILVQNWFEVAESYNFAQFLRSLYKSRRKLSTRRGRRAAEEMLHCSNDTKAPTIKGVDIKMAPDFFFVLKEYFLAT